MRQLLKSPFVQRSEGLLQGAAQRRDLELHGVQFVAKPNLSISVPDFLLGILGLYLQTNDAPPGRLSPRTMSSSSASATNAG